MWVEVAGTTRLERLLKMFSNLAQAVLKREAWARLQNSPAPVRHLMMMTSCTMKLAQSRIGSKESKNDEPNVKRQRHDDQISSIEVCEFYSPPRVVPKVIGKTLSKVSVSILVNLTNMEPLGTFVIQVIGRKPEMMWRIISHCESLAHLRVTNFPYCKMPTATKSSQWSGTKD